MITVKPVALVIAVIALWSATDTAKAETTALGLTVYGQLCPNRTPQLELLDHVEARRLRSVNYATLDKVPLASADAIRFLSELFQKQQAELASLANSTAYISQI